MFNPIEIHGDAENGMNEYYTRVHWDEEEGAIALDFWDEITGHQDGDTRLFSPKEAQNLGWALIGAYGSTFDASGKPKAGAHGGD